MAFESFLTPDENVYYISIIPFASNTKHRVTLKTEGASTILAILCDEDQIETVVDDYHKKAIEYYRLNSKFDEILKKSK